MHHDAKLQEKLIDGLQEIYGLENQIVETLEKHVQQAKDVPEIQSKVQQHLDATKQHRARMEQRLNAYNQKPSTAKGALASAMGNMMGLVSGSREDALAKNARDEYVTEHLEIASYMKLIAIATAFGDPDTVLAAELNLNDEYQMQQWLAQHMADVTLLSLQKEGITIPDDAWNFSKQVSSMPQPAESLARVGMETSK